MSWRASIFVAGGVHPVLEAHGASVLVVVLVASVIAGAARLAADVAPKLAGEELLLAVEIG